MNRNLILLFVIGAVCTSADNNLSTSTVTPVTDAPIPVTTTTEPPVTATFVPAAEDASVPPANETMPSAVDKIEIWFSNHWAEILMPLCEVMAMLALLVSSLHIPWVRKKIFQPYWIEVRRLVNVDMTKDVGEMSFLNRV